MKTFRAVSAWLNGPGWAVETKDGEQLIDIRQANSRVEAEAEADRLTALEAAKAGAAMTTKPLPRPRDPIALAKLIGDIATGQVVDGVDDGKDEAAAKMGRKGGSARAAAMTPERRAEIAKKAAKARWATSPAPAEKE